jgi:unsaturated chondroitin disaccharide hydrolase
MKKFAILSVSILFLAFMDSSSSELHVNEILDYVSHQYHILSERIVNVSDFISTGNPTSLTWNLQKVTHWTVGFYGGSLWMLYKLTGDVTWKKQALAYQERVKVRQFDTSTHDVGFVIMSTFGLGLELVGDPKFIPVIIQAAESLSTRYVRKNNNLILLIVLIATFSILHNFKISTFFIRFSCGRSNPIMEHWPTRRSYGHR